MLCRMPRVHGSRNTNRMLKPDFHHSDAVQDLKIIDNCALISCSRDCTVKVWR
jgi:hypothetical protein